jgi:hexosaminidase
LAFPLAASLPTTSAQAAACTRVIKGTHNGVLNVAANQKLCLRGAVQDGAVNVLRGGALSVVNSKITGAVTLKAGFTDLRFCGSETVRGAISARGARGSVLIGSGGTSCASNTIDGAVTLDMGNAGLRLADNDIAGAVTASSNDGRSTISGNRIAGSLTCSGNRPAPTNAGVTNAVAGGRSGQTCAASTF